MSKKKMDKHAFCPKCLKEVKPKRKKLDNFNYQLWIIIIISSLGFAIIPLLIYYFFIRKKKYCPKCGSEVEFYTSQRDFPKKIPVVNLFERLELDKNNINEEKEFEKEFTECYNCKKKIEKNAQICPYCGVTLKEAKIK